MLLTLLITTSDKSMKLKYTLIIIWILSVLTNFIVALNYSMYSEFLSFTVVFFPIMLAVFYSFTKESKDNKKRLEKLEREEEEKEAIKEKERLEAKEARVKRMEEEVKINGGGIVKFLLGLGAIILGIILIVALGPLWIIAIVLVLIFLAITGR